MGKIVHTNQRERCAPKNGGTLIHSIGSGLAVFAIYYCTCAPTVTGEDSGEFITAAYHFGVPHPPGYPLWTILCGIWLKVFDFGVIAWRANIFSGVCMAIGVGVMASVLRRMGFRPVIAGAAAIAAGLADAVWSQSTITEVYT